MDVWYRDGTVDAPIIPHRRLAATSAHHTRTVTTITCR
jgi:hypothetical protein